MQRTIEQWRNCDPEAMAKQSPGALIFAFEDAKRDVLELHSELERVRHLFSHAIDPIRDHPAHHMKWTPAEIEWIKAYGQRCVETYKASQRATPVPMNGERAISVNSLSAMALPLEGHDPQQSGTHWRKGWNDAIRQAMDYAQPAKLVPMTVEAVATVEDAPGPEFGVRLCWLVEGGLDSLPSGVTLLVAHRPITDNEGQGTVYITTPAHHSKGVA